jgi:tetratricopeptide (TPR) repeat protein
VDHRSAKGGIGCQQFNTERPGDFVTGKRIPYYLAGSVAFLTFIVYLPALQNDLIELDDAVYVLDNPYIRSFNLDLFQWAFFRFYAANWHPLTWISHAVDYALWGLNPLGHHLTNIILHAVNTALVILLTLKLLETARGRSTGNGATSLLNDRTVLIASGVTGLLFGIHPVHVESVAWVAERKDLLCALFFLLSVMMYVNYAGGQLSESEKKDEAGGKNVFTNKRYLLSLLLFVFALMSKPMAVSLPVVLLILDWYPFSRIHNVRTARTALVDKLPFIILSMGSSILTMMAQKTGGALVSAQLVPWSARVLVATRSLLAYLGKIVLPLDLAPYYPYPGLREIAAFRAEYLIPVILLIGITVACIMAMKQQKMWLAVWSYYVITLLPVLGIVQVGGQVMADRYTYLPSLSLFLAVGIVGAWTHTKSYAGAGSRQLIRGLGMATIAMIIILLSILTIRQIGIWKNSMVVFDAILTKESRRSPMVYFHRGVAYEKKGKFEAAIDDYTRAIALFPAFYEALFSRGSAYENIGKFDRAIEDYSEAISYKPSSYEAYTNRGLVNKKLGRLNEAIADFDRAVALSTSAGKAYLNIGIINAEAGRFVQAIEQFSRAISADPMDAEAYGNRGIAHAIIGQQGAALKDFNKAVELRPGFAAIYYNRGKLYAASGQQERALSDFQHACRLGDEISCRTLRE